MYEITPLRVLGVLAFYAAIFVIIRLSRERIEPFERKTFVAIGLVWAVSVFPANYLLYKAGAMSFLPWVNNFMHSFLWIGFCLSWLYLGVRENQPIVLQIVLFTTFSKPTPAASRTAARFSITRSVCARMSPATICWLAGSSGICPLV